MTNFPFDTISLDADEVQALEDTYNALKTKFKMAIPNNADQFVNKFELFNNNPTAKLGGTLFISYPETNCYLNLNVLAGSLAEEPAPDALMPLFCVLKCPRGLSRRFFRKGTCGD